MKKKKASVTNSENQSKTVPSFEEYFDFDTMRTRAVDELFIENFALEMEKWATEDQDALVLNEFYNKKKILNKDIERWAQKSESLQQAIEYAKNKIGNRLETGAMSGKYNAAMVSSILPHYSKTYRELAEWKASLAAKAREGVEHSGPAFVVIERFPSSDIVKPRAIDKSATT